MCVCIHVAWRDERIGGRGRTQRKRWRCQRPAGGQQNDRREDVFRRSRHCSRRVCSGHHPARGWTIARPCWRPPRGATASRAGRCACQRVLNAAAAPLTPLSAARGSHPPPHTHTHARTPARAAADFLARGRSRTQTPAARPLTGGRTDGRSHGASARNRARVVRARQRARHRRAGRGPLRRACRRRGGVPVRTSEEAEKERGGGGAGARGGCSCSWATERVGEGYGPATGCGGRGRGAVAWPRRDEPLGREGASDTLLAGGRWSRSSRSWGRRVPCVCSGWGDRRSSAAAHFRLGASHFACDGP